MQPAVIRQIEASFDERSIVVYQAYNQTIAQQAVAYQNFLFDDFKASRMTWIKPSFFWMMYRSGWASKQNQEHILAVTISRNGFDWALANACLSHFEAATHPSVEAWQAALSSSPVRVQWDPSRDSQLNPLPQQRAIQLGLSGQAVRYYAQQWIMRIEDITVYAHQVKHGTAPAAHDSFLNPVKPYPVPRNVYQQLGMSGPLAL